MSTFGEIVEPVTRTSWEDWDDVENTNEVPGLHWKTPLKYADTIEAFFILEGKFLSDFVKTQSKDHLSSINSISEVNLNLYQLQSSNQYVCTIKDYNLLQSSVIVELLRPILFKSVNVITIQTKPLMQYQSDNNSSEMCITRQVVTSRPSNESWRLKFSKLEQPNILSGVSAGAICLREHLDLSGTALVYFVEHVEEYQTDEIQKLLQKFQIVQKCNANVSGILSSNLYI